MALTPTAAWTKAMSIANPAVRYLVRLHVTASKSYDATTGGSAVAGALNAVVGVESVSATMNLLTRKRQTSEVTVTFDDSYLRHIMQTNRLKGRRVEILIGTEGLAEGDYLAFFDGVAEDYAPEDGLTIALMIMDALTIAESEKVRYALLNTHPHVAMHELLTLAGIPTALINTASFAFDVDATRAHWVVGLGRSSDGTTNAAVMEPRTIAEMFDDLARHVNGMKTVDETGKVRLVLYDDTTTAVDTWTAADFSEMSQSKTESDIVNKAIVSFVPDGSGVNGWVSEFTSIHPTSPGHYAYPGESTRYYTEAYESKWLDGLAYIHAVDASATEFTIFGLGVSSFCGALVPDNWPTSAQATNAKVLESTRDSWIQIDDEIMQVRTLVVDSAGAYTLNDGVDGGGADRKVPGRAVLTVYRAQLGTSATTHAQGARAVDITIAKAMTEDRIGRHHHGVHYLSGSTNLSKLWVQIGDFVNITDPRFVAYAKDGVSSSDYKFEVVGKEGGDGEGDPHVRWILASSDPDATAPTWAVINTTGRTIDASMGVMQSLDEGGNARVVSGLKVSAGSGLAVDITAGVAAALHTRNVVQSAQTLSGLPASQLNEISASPVPLGGFHVHSRHLATTVADLVFTTSAGTVTKLTSAGANLPTMFDGDLFRITSANTPTNNGVYRVTNPTATASSIGCTKIDSTIDPEDDTSSNTVLTPEPEAPRGYALLAVATTDGSSVTNVVDHRGFAVLTGAQLEPDTVQIDSLNNTMQHTLSEGINSNFHQWPNFVSP